MRDAIFWFSDGTTVRNNTFHDSRYGIHMMYTDGMQVLDNDLQGNSVGAYLMYSSNVLIRGNTFRRQPGAQRLWRGPQGHGHGHGHGQLFLRQPGGPLFRQLAQPGGHHPAH